MVSFLASGGSMMGRERPEWTCAVQGMGLKKKKSSLVNPMEERRREMASCRWEK